MDSRKMPDDDDLLQIVLRLQRTKKSHEMTVHHRGYNAGVSWVRNTAEYGEIKRLDEMYNDGCREYEVMPGDEMASEIARYCVETPDGCPDTSPADHLKIREQEIAAFWERVGAAPEDAQDTRYLLSFIDGAVGAWEPIAQYL